MTLRLKTAEPAWRAVARDLRAEGRSVLSIAKELGLSHPTVYRYLNPEADARYQARERRWKQANAKRIKVRAMAREEAAKTGEDFEAICARWGVGPLPKRDKDAA